MTPSETFPTGEPKPYWDYADVFAFAGWGLASLFMVGMTLRLLHLLNRPLVMLWSQLVWYVMVFAGLYLLLRTRYNRPVWRALGLVYRPGMLPYLVGGPPLAIGIGLLALALHTPQIPNPFEHFLAGPFTKFSFALFAVVLAPIAEELAFRGFLMPILMRSLGVAGGIVLTSAIFGAMHAPEYSHSWRHAVIISTVGLALGWARYRSGSTIASALMHSTFNLTQFAAFVAQGR